MAARRYRSNAVSRTQPESKPLKPTLALRDEFHHLVVRRLVRAHMTARGSALMVNLRHLHDHLHSGHATEMALKGDLHPFQRHLPCLGAFCRTR